ncbi:unnamed protein product [Closterium sp. NIES-54]
MHSRFLVFGLPRCLPPLPPSPAPPCIPCVEGWQRAAPHSSSVPPTEAPLQTLHLDVWGPARVRGQGHERYFLLVVDDYTRYTMVFPLQRKGDVPDVLIPWICATHLQLRERFQLDFPILRLHSDRGVMEVARTSMIHAAAPHFLWPFAVRYAAHQLNLWPRVSLPETSPTLLWTGKVGNASRFRVWGARAFVRDTTADKLSPRAIPCVFLGFVPDAPGWQFYDPASRRIFASQDVTFDKSVPIYCLFPYRTAPRPPPPPLFLALGPPQVDPLPSPGPAPSGVSQVDPPAPALVEVTGDSGPAGSGAVPGGAELGGAESGGAERVEPGGAESAREEPEGAASRGTASGGAAVRIPTPQGVLDHWDKRASYTRRFDCAALLASLGRSLLVPSGASSKPVYGLRQAPREWHDTLRTTLAALGFAPSTADPSLFLCTHTSLPLFYVLVYVDDLVFATADTEALALVKSELQKRHTCTDLGELHIYLGLHITQDRARRTITLTQSHVVHQVLQSFSFTWSSAQATPLTTGHSLSAPPSDESVEPSGPYPELVGCLMYLMTCTRLNLAYPLGLLARYVAPGRHQKVHVDAAKRVLRYLCSTSGMGLVLGGRGDVVLSGHSDASWAEIYATAMAAQELRWLTYLGERPRSPPVLYVDNKAAIALCQEHRLEHRTKHIALRYFLA